ncbi:MAG: SAM-dependent methyltransferase [Solirubrobacterales bacterium]
MPLLVCTHASLATVQELFRYKAAGFELPPFPGYTADQWGIKAHNRPWIHENGRWKKGQRVIELGGAYSRLPEWLGDTYGVEPWVGDDFGEAAGEPELWSRWGSPAELAERHPTVTYRLENFGPESSFPTGHFDRLFSVSTLEHIPFEQRLGVLKDAHRSLSPQGIELHTIDISIPRPWKAFGAGLLERAHLERLLRRQPNSIASWFGLLRASGVDTSKVKMPNSIDLLDRQVLADSPDVVYRFYPPVDAPSPFAAVASLLLVIESR